MTAPEPDAASQTAGNNKQYMKANLLTEANKSTMLEAFDSTFELGQSELMTKPKLKDFLQEF